MHVNFAVRNRAWMPPGAGGLRGFSKLYKAPARWHAECFSQACNRERDRASPKEDATMTNFTMKMMVAAATVVVAAGTASAQNLKADIPFTFRAGGKVMAAGTYRVSRIP